MCPFFTTRVTVDISQVHTLASLSSSCSRHPANLHHVVSFVIRVIPPLYVSAFVTSLFCFKLTKCNSVICLVDVRNERLESGSPFTTMVS